MLRQGLTLGLALLSGLARFGGRGWLRRSLQRRESRLQVGLVGGQGLGEEFTLLGAHALGLGAELPGFEQRQPEGDLLDLRVAPLDGLGR